MPVARRLGIAGGRFTVADGRNECLEAWTGGTREFISGIIDRNRCPAAARNAALRRARGEFIAYLDPGDEYYPNYFAEVVAAGQESDVLLFAFDIACENGFADGRPIAWDPGQVIDRLFAENIAAPLGVAHRRSTLERVGGFNELLCRGEDWDFWKRLARAGLVSAAFRARADGTAPRPTTPIMSGPRRPATANREQSPRLSIADLGSQLSKREGRSTARGQTRLKPDAQARLCEDPNSLALRASMPVAQVANLPEISLQRQVGKGARFARQLRDATSSRSPSSRRIACWISVTGRQLDPRSLAVLESLGFRVPGVCGPRPVGTDKRPRIILHRHATA